MPIYPPDSRAQELTIPTEEELATWSEQRLANAATRVRSAVAREEAGLAHLVALQEAIRGEAVLRNPEAHGIPRNTDLADLKTIAKKLTAEARR
jgi:hypothetical protein